MMYLVVSTVNWQRIGQGFLSRWLLSNVNETIVLSSSDKPRKIKEAKECYYALKGFVFLR